MVGCRPRSDGVTVEVQHDGYAWLPGRPMLRRRLNLTRRGLEVCDRVDGGRYDATSRLLVNPAADVRVSADGEPHETEARWYPEHGRARRAVRFAQAVQSDGPSGATWRVEW